MTCRSRGKARTTASGNILVAGGDTPRPLARHPVGQGRGGAGTASGWPASRSSQATKADAPCTIRIPTACLFPLGLLIRPDEAAGGAAVIRRQSSAAASKVGGLRKAQAWCSCRHGQDMASTGTAARPFQQAERIRQPIRVCRFIGPVLPRCRSRPILRPSSGTGYFQISPPSCMKHHEGGALSVMLMLMPRRACVEGHDRNFHRQGGRCLEFQHHADGGAFGQRGCQILQHQVEA